jgi:hypothetical protein
MSESCVRYLNLPAHANDNLDPGRSGRLFWCAITKGAVRPVGVVITPPARDLFASVVDSPIPLPVTGSVTGTVTGTVGLASGASGRVNNAVTDPVRVAT